MGFPKFTIPALTLFLAVSFHQAASAEAVSVDQNGLESPDLAQQSTAAMSAPLRTIFLPTGDLFRPLLADPKEPRFYLSYRLFKYRTEQIHGAVAGYGEIFGLYRHVNTEGGYTWQANLGGGVHAQFDLHTPSLDLVNADYTVGFPFTFRKGPESYRITLYHQSSHLGDEFLLHNNIDRVELSYEVLDGVGSYEWKTWRVYYGGGYMVHREPSSLKPGLLHGGLEYYAADHVFGNGRLVGGWDIKCDEEHEWSLNSSVKFGLQFDGSGANGRYIRLLVEGYKGFSPYGQFYTDKDRMTYAGIGFYLGFE